MELKINDVSPPSFPDEFVVTVMDLDDKDGSFRGASGKMSRDRIAVKRQIDMSWGPLSWPHTSAILNLIKDEFFNVYYPDPQEGGYVTKKFYPANRPATFIVEKDGEMLWGGVKVTLVEE